MPIAEFGKLTDDGRNLYVGALNEETGEPENKKVIKGWESYSGWYWFALEKTGEYNGKPVWFGLVQGLETEFGSFSEYEMVEMIRRRMIWQIKIQDLPHSGRRG